MLSTQLTVRHRSMDLGDTTQRVRSRGRRRPLNRRAFLGSCVAPLAASLAEAPASRAAPRPLVIDAHGHWGYLGMYGQPDISIEQMLAVAGRAGIDKLCVSSIEAIEWDMREGNRIVNQLMKRYPDRIIGFATLPSPHFGSKGLEEIRRAVEEYGMKGVGELETNAQDPLDIRAWIAVLELAARLKVPVLAHAAAAPCVHAAQRVPEATILLAHLGTGLGAGTDEWIQAIGLVKPFPNILVETCTSITCTGQIELAVRELGAERVVFGTDQPLLDPIVQRAKIEDAEIPAEARPKILGQNMARILKLPPLA